MIGMPTPSKKGCYFIIVDRLFKHVYGTSGTHLQVSSTQTNAKAEVITSMHLGSHHVKLLLYMAPLNKDNTFIYFSFMILPMGIGDGRQAGSSVCQVPVQNSKRY